MWSPPVIKVLSQRTYTRSPVALYVSFYILIRGWLDGDVWSLTWFPVVMNLCHSTTFRVWLWCYSILCWGWVWLTVLNSCFWKLLCFLFFFPFWFVGLGVECWHISRFDLISISVHQLAIRYWLFWISIRYSTWHIFYTIELYLL